MQTDERTFKRQFGVFLFDQFIPTILQQVARYLFAQVVYDTFGHEKIHAEEPVETHENAHDRSEDGSEDHRRSVEMIGNAIEAALLSIVAGLGDRIGYVQGHDRLTDVYLTEAVRATADEEKRIVIRIDRTRRTAVQALIDHGMQLLDLLDDVHGLDVLWTTVVKRDLVDAVEFVDNVDVDVFLSRIQGDRPELLCERRALATVEMISVQTCARIDVRIRDHKETIGVEIVGNRSDSVGDGSG